MRFPRKRKTSGRGPDGVGQMDLAALPPQAVSACVSILKAVEDGARWPTQVASGFVNSLAKHLQAQHIDDYRACHCLQPLLPGMVFRTSP